MIQFNLKRVLAAKGVTQKELAAHTGIRPPTISALCTGAAKHIPVEVLDRICADLGCQPGDLFSFGSEV